MSKTTVKRIIDVTIMILTALGGFLGASAATL